MKFLETLKKTFTRYIPLKLFAVLLAAAVVIVLNSIL